MNRPDVDTCRLERRVRHKYSIETLYHFKCGFCNDWWAIGDWKSTGTLVCPHCGQLAGLEMMPNAPVQPPARKEPE
jgi:transcription elongation factor Elf1